MTPDQEIEQLRAVGDTLQSGASRLAEWAEDQGSATYEVRGAIYEIERAVEQWTMIRSQSKLTTNVMDTGNVVPPEGAETHRMLHRHAHDTVATITYSDGTKSTVRHAPDEDVDALAERVAPLGATVKLVDRKPGPCPHDKPAYQWCDECHG